LNPIGSDTCGSKLRYGNICVQVIYLSFSFVPFWDSSEVPFSSSLSEMV
jgi:hypothetical protein